MIDKSKPYGTKSLSMNRLASIFQKGLKLKPYAALGFSKIFLEKDGCELKNIGDVSASYSDEGKIVIQYTEYGVQKQSIL